MDEIVVNIDLSTIENSIIQIIEYQKQSLDFFIKENEILKQSLFNLQSYFFIFIVLLGISFITYLFYRFVKTFI